MVSLNNYGIKQGWKVKKADEGVKCSLVSNPVIYIEPIPKYKIELLMEEYASQEWLAYLVGKVSKKNNIFVEDISVPPHESVTSASAEAEPFNIPDDCVGIIHSHHSMGAFHSGTDQNYVDKNFLVSITVARNTAGLSFDAVSCQQTPCGKTTTGKSVVKYVRPDPTFDSEAFLKEAKDNIDKGKFSRVVIRYGNEKPSWPEENDDEFSNLGITGYSDEEIYPYTNNHLPSSIKKKYLSKREKKEQKRRARTDTHITPLYTRAAYGQGKEGETAFRSQENPYVNKSGVVVSQKEAERLAKQEGGV